ncbi:MAG: DUF6491 family protein [Woeseiaceae bacterium]
MIKQIITIAFLSGLLGCASSDPANSDAPEGEISSRTDCISQGSIRDYRVLDDANLIVTERASRKYHVELSRRVYGFRASRSIGFESDSSRICGRFDDIVVDGSLGVERVPIASIRRLTPEQEEDLLIRFGIIEPEYKQPRRPVEVEGAEVEELD